MIIPDYMDIGIVGDKLRVTRDDGSTFVGYLDLIAQVAVVRPESEPHKAIALWAGTRIVTDSITDLARISIFEPTS